MTSKAQKAVGTTSVTVLADRGCFKGQQVLSTEQPGAVPLAPTPHTSKSKAMGLRDRKHFVYIPQDDEYECSAKQCAISRFTSIQNGTEMRQYRSS